VLHGNQQMNKSFQGTLAHGAIAMNLVTVAEEGFEVTPAIDELEHGWIQESC
jgi:hypothetical protein